MAACDEKVVLRHMVTRVAEQAAGCRLPCALERRRRDAWRPPLDEVDVSAVRLSPDFREATVTWRLAESLRPPRSRFFADAAPPLQNPDRLEAAEAALARVAGGLRAEVARRARRDDATYNANAICELESSSLHRTSITDGD